MEAGKEVWISAQGPTGADVQIMLGDQVIQRIVDADLTMHKDDYNRLTITVMGVVGDMKAVAMLPIDVICPVCKETIEHDCKELKRGE
jgi:hypothetical protein